MKTLTLPNSKIHSGNLILVNADHRYQNTDHTNLVKITGPDTDIRLERCAAALLSELMYKIQAENQIIPVSGWRSKKEQQTIWNDSIQESGKAFTQKYVAVPGHSEHQTGLAIDLGLKKEKIDFICPDFPYNGICKMFRRLAAYYGFVERYPKGKETITGIGHEPWHFRYVGIPHALIMTKYHLTLEEYIDFIRFYPYQKSPYIYQEQGSSIAVSYLAASEHTETFVEVDTDKPYMLSGNNIDGFIITEWRRAHGA